MTLKFAIMNKNETFIRDGIISGLIKNNLLYEVEVQELILKLFENGETFILGINLVSMMKMNLINIKFCNRLLKNMKLVFNYVKESQSLLNCYNPIFAISLTSEILDKIGSQFHMVEITCPNLKNSILELGNIIIDKVLDEEIYMKMMDEKDFRNRTTIDLICSNRLTQLLQDEKSEKIFTILLKGPEGVEKLESLDVMSTVHNTGKSNFNLSVESNKLQKSE
jgi:hypothetical protein